MRHFASVSASQTVGVNAYPISVEADITKKTLFAFSIVGLPDKAVEEARDRTAAALKNSGFSSPKTRSQKTVISLAPAQVKKEGALFDVPIALSYLLAMGEISFNPEEKVFLGELSLEGVLRPIRGAVLLAQAAQKNGVKEMYVPKENAREAALVPNITVYGIETLTELIDHLVGAEVLTPEPPIDFSDSLPELEDHILYIKGQESAKRALEIAAAGGHNVGLSGPPGTGKTLLARALSEILPPPSFEEALEITGIHSVSGELDDDMVSTRPFRAPHHTASHVSIAGGGAIPKPGEITLAHRGVLFLDEFPEFEKRVIEVLRQPLEDGEVRVARSRGSDVFPADILLVAAMNPCPCGFYETEIKPCVCTPGNLERYQRKLSGPIVDRVDLWAEVGAIDHKTLLEKHDGESAATIRERVIAARGRQKSRWGTDKTNSQAGPKDIGKFIITDDAKAQLNEGAARLGLSARGYHKVMKVAQTIADLNEHEKIESSDVLEAFQYRKREQK